MSSRVTLVDKSDRILLGLRKNAKYASGKWMLPGGTKERNETALQAVLREAAEEIAVKLDPADLTFVGVVHWYQPLLDVDGPTFVWSTRKWGYISDEITEPTNNEVHKCAGLDWFTHEQIRELHLNDDVESTTIAILDKFMNNEIGVYIECDWVK